MINSILSFLKKHLSIILFPVLLLLVMLAAYAIFLFRMGYYWDDWQAIYLFQFQSPALYWDYFLGDRPISAWTFILFQPLLGMQAWHWQLATIFSRALGVWLLCAAFWRIWPAHRKTLQWMGLLLAVYPGFSQQNISVAYHQHFTTFVLFAASMYFMVRAMQSTRAAWRWTIPAVLTGLLNMLTMEYFVGLEALRPILIYMLLQKRQPDHSLRKHLGNSFRKWLPYFGTLVLFGIYRFLIYPSISMNPEMNSPTALLSIFSNPIAGLLHLIELIVQDMAHIMGQVWLNGMQPDAFQLSSKMVLFSWVVGLLIAMIVFFVSKLWIKNEITEFPDSRPATQMMLVGFLAILFGGLPVWMTDRQSIVGLWSDRFTLAPMIGVCLLICALTAWLIQQERKREVVFSVLLMLSIPLHIQTANKYRLNSEMQHDFYQQLAWRAPAVKPGTAFAASGLPFSHVGDYAVGFGVNTLYGLSEGAEDLPLWWFNAGRQWGIDALMEMNAENETSYKLRNLTYTGTANELVGLIYNPSRGCLRVMDSVYELAPPMDDYQLHEINMALSAFSHPQQILSSDDLQFSEAVFGTEDKESWCYYYQKADLARQFEDWQRVSDLYQQSQEKQLSARHGAEFTPFILAAAHQGDWNEAATLTRSADALTPDMQPMLCSLWQNMPQQSPVDAGQVTASAEMRTYLSCE
ncbi:MAG: hypothetical protein JEZ00_07040 [Anaerolineaceae bacterium]|nr:hypothetical protein [Anaerolineaceae bacterium]